jgi:hypothetical protein
MFKDYLRRRRGRRFVRHKIGAITIKQMAGAFNRIRGGAVIIVARASGCGEMVFEFIRICNTEFMTLDSWNAAIETFATQAVRKLKHAPRLAPVDGADG